MAIPSQTWMGRTSRSPGLALLPLQAPEVDGAMADLRRKGAAQVLVAQDTHCHQPRCQRRRPAGVPGIVHALHLLLQEPQHARLHDQGLTPPAARCLRAPRDGDLSQVPLHLGCLGQPVEGVEGPCRAVGALLDEHRQIEAFQGGAIALLHELPKLSPGPQGIQHRGGFVPGAFDLGNARKGALPLLKNRGIAGGGSRAPPSDRRPGQEPPLA